MRREAVRTGDGGGAPVTALPIKGNGGTPRYKVGRLTLR